MMRVRLPLLALTAALWGQGSALADEDLGVLGELPAVLEALAAAARDDLPFGAPADFAYFVDTGSGRAVSSIAYETVNRALIEGECGGGLGWIQSVTFSGTTVLRAPVSNARLVQVRRAGTTGAEAAVAPPGQWQVTPGGASFRVDPTAALAKSEIPGRIAGTASICVTPDGFQVEAIRIRVEANDPDDPGAFTFESDAPGADEAAPATGGGRISIPLFGPATRDGDADARFMFDGTLAYAWSATTGSDAELFLYIQEAKP